MAHLRLAIVHAHSDRLLTFNYVKILQDDSGISTCHHTTSKPRHERVDVVTKVQLHQFSYNDNVIVLLNTSDCYICFPWFDRMFSATKKILVL